MNKEQEQLAAARIRESIELKQMNALCNTYFILVEAADVLMRAMDRWFKQKKESHLSGEIKNLHNNMMRQMRALNVTSTKYWEFYSQTFGGDHKWRKLDALRGTGADMAKMCLLINDRCSNESMDGEVTRQIMEMITQLPPQGCVSNKMLQDITMQ